MKLSGHILSLVVFLVGGHLLAVPFNLEDEGEDFVKDLLKAIPEKANGLSSLKARKAIFKELQDRKVFYANGDIRYKLEDGDEVFSQIAIETVSGELVKVAGEDKYAHFLLNKIKEKRLDDAERVILMREIAYQTKELKASIKLEEIKKLSARKKPLVELMSFYLDFTNRQKKPAQTLDELGLPEHLKASQDGKPWMYYGEPGADFFIQKKKLIFIEPTPDENGKVFAVDVFKKTHLLTVDVVQRAIVHYNKVQEQKAKKAQETKQTSKADPDKKVIAPESQKEIQRQLENQQKTQFILAATKQLKGVNEKLKVFRNRGPLPLTISELKLPKDLQKAKSADGKSSQDWIYLEGKLNVKSNGYQRLLVVYPFDLGGGEYISLLSDGSTALIKAPQLQEIKAALAKL